MTAAIFFKEPELYHIGRLHVGTVRLRCIRFILVGNENVNCIPGENITMADVPICISLKGQTVFNS